MISDYIIHKHGCEFTPFQLIKMVFISHGRTLAAYKMPLIRDRIEAWKYGPVIPLLYHELKIWGDNPVRRMNYCNTLPGNDNKVDSMRREFFESVIDRKERSIIDDVVAEYSKWSFRGLKRLCHEVGSPWDTHYNGKFGTEIPDSTIQRYYEKKIL